MLPLSPIQVDVKPESSCHHWTCCFGCKCWKSLNSEEEKQASPISITETETVTRTYERHRHQTPPGSSSPPLLRRVMALSPQQASELEFPIHLNSASIVSHQEIKIEDEKEKEKERVCRLHNGSRVYKANDES